MSEGTRNRRETRAVFLRERFESNISLIEKTIWQGEKDFTLEIPVNLQNDRVYGKISLMKIYLVRKMLESLAGCRTMFLFAVSCKICVGALLIS